MALLCVNLDMTPCQKFATVWAGALAQLQVDLLDVPFAHRRLAEHLPANSTGNATFRLYSVVVNKT